MSERAVQVCDSMRPPCCQRHGTVPCIEQLCKLQLYGVELLRPEVEDSPEVRSYEGLGVNTQQALHAARVSGQTDSDQPPCSAQCGTLPLTCSLQTEGEVLGLHIAGALARPMVSSRSAMHPMLHGMLEGVCQAPIHWKSSRA